jgi:anti-sigma B factor antagonist
MFNIDKLGIWTVVHPAGEIDMAVAAAFRAAVLETLSGTDRLAIDFSEVTFLDSSGISVIATALNETYARGGRLVLVALSERTRQVLDITGLTKILDIRDALDGTEHFAVEWTIAEPKWA